MSAIEIGIGIAIGFFMLPIIVYLCGLLAACVIALIAKIFNLFVGDKF